MTDPGDRHQSDGAADRTLPSPDTVGESDVERLAHFKVLGRLGQGGMGIVYRARDEKLGRLVALKVLPDSFAKDERRRRRFLREARSAAAVTHANIATVYEADEADGHVYIAMELVEGETLRGWLATEHDLAEALRIATDVARGLARAHDKGVVHRDLKPENVMVTRHGEVKILDFGLAKLRQDGAPNASALEHEETSTAITREGGVVGTPAYMSPEQARGLPVDARTDVFSFGVMLYELLAGERPFRGETTQDILAAVVRDTPERISVRNPFVTGQVERVVLRCLEKAPEERYGSGQELVDALVVVTTAAGEEMGASHRVVGAAPTPSLLTPGASASTPRDRARWRRPVLLLAAAASVIVVGSVAAMRSLAGPGVQALSPGVSAPIATAPLASTGGYVVRKLVMIGKNAAGTTALSPDGTQLAFAADNEAIWVRGFAGGVPKRLGFQEGSVLSVQTMSFFPDGKRLLVSITKDGSRSTTYVAPVDGSPPSVVAGLDGDATLAPDGLHVALNFGKSVAVTTLGGGPRITVTTCNIHCEDVAWRPDGTRLAVYDRDPSLRVVRADGSGSETLLSATSLAALYGSVAWPTPDRLLFHCTLDAGEPSVCELVVDAAARATSPPRVLWPAGDRPIRLSVSGDHIAVTLQETRSDIYVTDATGRGDAGAVPQRLTFNDEGMTQSPAWLPDGRLVYSFWKGRDFSSILVQALGAAEPSVFISLAGPRFTVLRTGELLYHRAYPIDAGYRERLARGGPGGSHDLSYQPEDSPEIRCGGGDPTRCVVREFHDGELTLARLDPEKGPSEPFFRRRVPRPAGFDVSPDGATAALTSEDEIVTFVPVSGGEPSAISTVPHCAQLRDLSYAVDGRSIVTFGYGFKAAVAGIIRVGVDGRGALLVRGSDYLASPGLSPDGTKLVWTQWHDSVGVRLLEPR